MDLERRERIAAARRAQPLTELARKADKAQRRQQIWTQEDLELAQAEAREWARWWKGTEESQ